VKQELADKKQVEPSLAFGGQALIEGVMIRSRTHKVLAVRKPNKEIVTNIEPFNSYTQRYKILGVPFVRGIVAMSESLYLGFKGLFFSANVAVEEEGEAFTNKEFAVAIALAVVVTGVFFVVPFLLVSLLGLHGVLFNVVEAIARLTLFIVYLVVISSWGEFRRVLQYHGAEHKAINAYEAGVPMDVENVKHYSRLHPRCGTSFLFIVIIISIVVFSLMPDRGFAVNLSYRVLLIPVIAAISYELLRLSGKYRDSSGMKIFTAPGLLFQRLTTKEPTEDMLEVSIKAVTETNRLIFAESAAKPGAALDSAA
jgi:uncharacterized protein YqhQ